MSKIHSKDLWIYRRHGERAGANIAQAEVGTNLAQNFQPAVDQRGKLDRSYNAWYSEDKRPPSSYKELLLNNLPSPHKSVLSNCV